MRIFAFCLSLIAAPVTAHELWIEPAEFQVAPETKLTADLVNGEEFKGTKLPFLPRNHVRFVIFHGDAIADVTGRLGDLPALSMPAMGNGLHTVAYISRPSTLTYETWEKFQKFVDHKDLGNARAVHEAKGWPLEGFKESYIRYSKSLIAVGDANGADRRLGMETELVALDNPYTEPGAEDGMMRLQLYYQRGVRADEQVEIFERAPDGTVTISLVRTDADGIATVPVKSGHDYMADAVVLREADLESTGALWQTLWANLTWAMP